MNNSDTYLKVPGDPTEAALQEYMHRRWHEHFDTTWAAHPVTDLELYPKWAAEFLTQHKKDTEGIAEKLKQVVKLARNDDRYLRILVEDLLAELATGKKGAERVRDKRAAFLALKEAK